MKPGRNRRMSAGRDDGSFDRDDPKCGQPAPSQGPAAADSAVAVGIVLKLVAAGALHRPSPAGERAILTLVRCTLDGDAAADVVLRHALSRRPTRHRSKRRASRRDGGSR